MVNAADFEKAIGLISDASDVLITTHTRPDGDACASVAALYDALTALGKRPTLLFLSEIPQWYEHLFTEKIPILGRDVTLDRPVHETLELSGIGRTGFRLGIVLSEALGSRT